MKKTLTLLLTLAMLFTLAACGSSAAPSKGEKEEIIVFAAASMTETLNQVKDVYEKENNVTITYNFDSSGTLKTQIQEGADCDLFISAGQKQMNQLDLSSDKEINKEGLDFVAGDTRLTLIIKRHLVEAHPAYQATDIFSPFLKTVELIHHLPVH